MLAMAVVLLPACEAIRKSHPDASLVLFADDRTFATTAAAAFSIWEMWQQWSQQLGLKENLDKAWFFSRSKKVAADLLPPA